MVDPKFPNLRQSPKPEVIISNALPPIYKSALHLYREAIANINIDEIVQFKCCLPEATYEIDCNWLFKQIEAELRPILSIQKQVMIEANQSKVIFKFSHGIDITSPIEKHILTLI